MALMISHNFSFYLPVHAAFVKAPATQLVSQYQTGYLITIVQSCQMGHFPIEMNPCQQDRTAHLRWHSDPVNALALLGVEVKLIVTLQVGQTHEATHCQVLATVGPLYLQPWHTNSLADYCWPWCSSQYNLSC